MSQLASFLKSKLSEIERVRILTPMDPDRSTGLVTFGIVGMTGPQISQTLRERWNIGSRPAWHEQACRVAIGFFTIESELEVLVDAVRAMAHS